MLEVADIFRRHSAAYRATHRLLPSQLRGPCSILRRVAPLTLAAI